MPEHQEVNIRKLILVSAVALGLSVSVAVPSHAETMPRPSTTKTANLLFSVVAKSSTVNVSQYSTSISVPADSMTLWFADRPVRRAGAGTVTELVSNWTGYGFDKVPPNAALVTSKDGQTMQQVVILSKPRLNAGVASFTIKKLPTTAPVMGMKTSGPELVAGNYGSTQMFIDDTPSVYCGAWGLGYFNNDAKTSVTLSNIDGSQVFYSPYTDKRIQTQYGFTITTYYNTYLDTLGCY